MPKISNLELTFRGDQHIVGLDVTMHNAGTMGETQSRAGLQDKRNSIFHFKRPVLSDDRFQVGSGTYP